MGFRRRATSLYSMSDESNCSAKTDFFAKDIAKKPMSLDSVSYFVTSTDLSIENQHSDVNLTSKSNLESPVHEFAKSKRRVAQPAGTVEYVSSSNDTIDSVALLYDTTPSIIQRLNRLNSRMIFPGQVLYVPVLGGDIDLEPCKSPGKEHIDSSIIKTTSSAIVKTGETEPCQASGSTSRLQKFLTMPGRAVRQLSKISNTDHAGFVYETSGDKETSTANFIKINAKYITQNKGTVSGVLLVTPHSLMFDPDVTDPLVNENGCEAYGIITSIDLLVSTALYRDVNLMEKEMIGSVNMESTLYVGSVENSSITRSPELKSPLKGPCDIQTITEMEEDLRSNKGDDFCVQSSNTKHSLLEQDQNARRLRSCAATQAERYVDFSSGLFTKESNVQDVSEAPFITSESERELKLMKLPNRSRSVDYNLQGSRQQKTTSKHLEDEFPSVFNSLNCDIDSFRPKLKITLGETPPLYLCVKANQEMKRTFQKFCTGEILEESDHELCSQFSYWFAIPSSEGDNLYAFFRQWSPTSYGRDEEVHGDGFLVLENEGMVDESTPHGIGFVKKDWELVSKKAEVRRNWVGGVLPQILVEGEANLLSMVQMIAMSRYLPARTEGHKWCIVYSTFMHGFSLSTLYRSMQDIDSCILLVIKDEDGNIFGALASEPIHVSDTYYGSGESFLFKYSPQLETFSWTGENDYFMKGDRNYFVIGGGSGTFGVWLDADLIHGRCMVCETFNNPILSSKEDFEVLSLEAWCFIAL